MREHMISMLDAGRLTPLRVAGPGFGEVELAAGQGVAARGRVGQVDRDLRVLDPPGRSGVLALHAGSHRALCRAGGYAAPARLGLVTGALAGRGAALSE
jgi:hypothetical protein